MLEFLKNLRRSMFSSQGFYDRGQCTDQNTFRLRRASWFGF
jgi:hypothetical protein